MPAPSLREIEQLLTDLWLNENVRAQFLHDQTNTSLLSKQIDRDGVELYASLLQFGQQDLMSSIYPLSAKLLKHKWESTVASYFRRHPAKHYHLNEAGRRFREYLREDQPHLLKTYPFAPELADYEWIEMEVLEKNINACKQPNLVLNQPDHFMKYSPVLNPVLILRKYSYSISKIAHQLEIDKSLRGLTRPAISYVVCYRDPETNRATFLDLSELPFEIIQALIDAPHSYAELAKLTISRLPTAPESSVAQFLDINETFQKLNVFIGSAPVDA